MSSRCLGIVRFSLILGPRLQNASQAAKYGPFKDLNVTQPGGSLVAESPGPHDCWNFDEERLCAAHD